MWNSYLIRTVLLNYRQERAVLRALVWADLGSNSESTPSWLRDLGYITLLCLSFLMHKMGLTTTPDASSCCEG